MPRQATCDLCGVPFTKEGLKRHRNKSRCQKNRFCAEIMREIKEWAQKNDMIKVGGTWSMIIQRAGIPVVRKPGSAKCVSYSGGDERSNGTHTVYTYDVNWAESWAVKVSEVKYVDPDTRYSILMHLKENPEKRNFLTSLLLMEGDIKKRAEILEEFSIAGSYGED